MKPWALIALCTFAWAFWAVAQKMALRSMTPLMTQMVGAYVYSAVAPVVLLYMKATRLPTEWNVPGVLWTSASVVLATVAGISFVYALQRAQTHVVLGITSANPVIVFVICAAFLGEEVTLLRAIGMGCVVVGVTLLGL